ncbi:MAG: hypothetical protein K9G46_03155 [Flavobacteriales bacterium]|nr:hypothetical protein [Flavobacteriales bacterium]
MKTKIIITAIAFGFFGIANIQAQEKTEHDHAKMEASEATYDCPMKCEGDKVYKEAGACPECGMDLTKHEVKAEAKTFYCPMKCEGDKVYEKEGKCPKCGMALVEKKEEGKKDDHSGHKH